MHRPGTDSRIALILRRLRGRFGIAAPKLAVRTHVAWYWRTLTAIVMVAFALALAGWTYDVGRRFAGFDRSASDQEISTLRTRLSSLEAESERLRGVANASESQLRIERTALDRLSKQVKALEEENSRLRENLAVFENIGGGNGRQESVILSRLRIEAHGPRGQFRYRFMASLRDRKGEQAFSGQLQFQIGVQRPSGEGGIMILPEPGDPLGDRYAVSFRGSGSIEGHFQVPSDVRVKQVEVRLLRDGVAQATQSLTL
jgi:hypothetical protein